jgi:hypothetical protein
MYVGFMSSSNVVKSPTDVADDPTFVLAPAVLILTCRRSANPGVVTVRVQNDIVWPLVRVTTGVNSQLLMVPVPAVLLKLAAMYELGAPVCDGNTALLPWNQVACVPIGDDRFCRFHPPPGSVVTSSKPCASGVHDGDGDGVGLAEGVGLTDGLGLGEGVGVGEGLGLGVGVGDGPTPQPPDPGEHTPAGRVAFNCSPGVMIA